MEVSRNIRQRRKERIAQLSGKRQPPGLRLPETPEAGVRQPAIAARDPAQVAPGPPVPPPRTEPDPEEWWKARQREQRRIGWGTAGGSDGPGDEAPPLGSHFARGLAIRAALSAAIFAAVWGWLRLDGPGSDGVQRWVTAALTEDMDFAAVQAWYAETFGGAPAFLPMFRDEDAGEAEPAWRAGETVLPVNGRLVQTFAQSGSGVRIAAPAGELVRAVHAGRVLQVEEEGSGTAAVLIQHPDRIVTISEPVADPAVKPGDWVEAGDALGRLPASADGEAGESALVFTVRRDGRALDPADVVPFD